MIVSLKNTPQHKTKTVILYKIYATNMKELQKFIQNEETKKTKKREELVKGFDEGIAILYFFASCIYFY